MGLTPTPATTETHGPFRRVVDVVDVPAHAHTMPNGHVDRVPARKREILECGHHGKLLWQRPWGWDQPRKRRRCTACLPAWEAEQDERARQEAAYRAAVAAEGREVERARRAALTPGERAAEDEAAAAADVEARVRRTAIRAANRRTPPQR